MGSNVYNELSSVLGQKLEYFSENSPFKFQTSRCQGTQMQMGLVLSLKIDFQDCQPFLNLLRNLKRRGTQHFEK